MQCTSRERIPPRIGNRCVVIRISRADIRRCRIPAKNVDGLGCLSRRSSTRLEIEGCQCASGEQSRFFEIASIGAAAMNPSNVFQGANGIPAWRTELSNDLATSRFENTNQRLVPQAIHPTNTSSRENEASRWKKVAFFRKAQNTSVMLAKEDSRADSEYIELRKVMVCYLPQRDDFGLDRFCHGFRNRLCVVVVDTEIHNCDSHDALVWCSRERIDRFPTKYRASPL